MPQQPQQNPGPDGSVLIAELIKAVFAGCCLTIEVFIHGGEFGCRYITSGLTGVVVIFVFLGFCPNDNPLPLLWFMAAYALVWLARMIAMVIRRWRGLGRLHSAYTGRPYLGRLLPTMKEETVKTLESLTVFAVGFWVGCLNAPLGDYMMLTSALMFLRGVMLSSRQRAEAIELNDMVIEQKLVADRFRDMQQR